MKKVLIIIMAVMALGLAGCGATQPSVEGASTSNEEVMNNANVKVLSLITTEVVNNYNYYGEKK